MREANQKQLFFWILLIPLMSGCSHHQQTVKEEYPGWGEEIFLNTAKRTTPLHIRFLAPKTFDAVQGCLLIVHGMNEYIGRYRHIVDYFTDRFIIAGVDLTGHGLTNPILRQAHEDIKAGAENYDVSNAYLEQARLRNLTPMRDDVNEALRYLVDRCDAESNGKPLPVFILSHSLGSLVAASYLLNSRQIKSAARVKGIIFSGPAFSVSEVPVQHGRFQTELVQFSFRTHEHFLRCCDTPLLPAVLNQLVALITVPLQDAVVEFMSLPGIRSLISPKTPDWVVEYLTDWEEERDRYRTDNYIIRRTILRYVLEIEKEIIRFRRKMDRFDVPYLLIYSEFDPITPAWGSIDFAAATHRHHHDNETMTLRGENHHEQLFSSPALRKQVFKKIDEWVGRRLETLEVGS